MKQRAGAGAVLGEGGTVFEPEGEEVSLAVADPDERRRPRVGRTALDARCDLGPGVAIGAFMEIFAEGCDRGVPERPPSNPEAKSENSAIAAAGMTGRWGAPWASGLPQLSSSSCERRRSCDDEARDRGWPSRKVWRVGAAVIVSGMIAATPRQGGATWAVLQYLLGLRRLGCDVYFIEPVAEPSGLHRTRSATVEDVMARSGWRIAGRSSRRRAEIRSACRAAELRELARRADLLLSVSGMLARPRLAGCRPRPRLPRSGPRLQPSCGTRLKGSTCGSTPTRISSRSRMRSGRPECPIPTCGREWFPTLPPVVLDEWPVAGRLERHALTTVGHWRSYGSIHHDGVHYGQKVHSLRAADRSADPHTGTVRARARHPPGRGRRPRRPRGQRLDGCRSRPSVAATPDDYRRFVQGSWAEFGLAKLGYVVSDSGWFSDRSACYLASGRPVIAQDTGFGRRLPVGEGLLAFSSADGATAAIADLARDYKRHRRAARQVAAEHLDSDRVLARLLERLL